MLAGAGCNLEKRGVLNVFPARGNIVDTLHPFLIAGALRLRQRALVFLEVPRIFDLAAIGQRSQCAQAEIDANFAGTAGLALSNLDLEAEIPAPTRVLREASGLDLAIDRAATPEPITAAEIDHGVAVEFDGARGRKRDPAEAFLPPPVRAAARFVSIDNKLPADGLHGIAVQTEERTAPSRELDKIEGTRPTFFLASRCLLRFAAEVPNAIHRHSMGTEALGGGCILNAVSIGEDHTLHLIRRLSLARAAASKRTKEAIELKEILFGFETDKGYSAFVARCCRFVTAFARRAG